MDTKLYEKLADTFKDLKDFTAIFSYDDIVAANCIKALQKIGYKVPEDISIVGVNNSSFTNFIEPSLRQNIDGLFTIKTSNRKPF